MHRVVFGFFFFSGFTSLVFEVLWERSLARVFGTTSLALSTLLTAFMAGLALGAWLAGRHVDRVKRPLRAYGLLEGGIGLYALLVPLLLEALPSVYGVMFDRLFDQPILFATLRFVAVFLILVIPTTLMGASLPFVSQWMSSASEYFQGKVGWLYATNTLGACAGTLLAGFVFLPALGLELTNQIFAAMNVALCIVVVVSEATFLRDPSPATTDLTEEMGAAMGRAAVADPIGRFGRRSVLVAFALSGVVTMTYQVLWTRAYLIVLGSSTYSFTLVLTAFLLGLGGGGAVASTFVERIRRPLVWLAASQLVLVAFAALTFRILDDLPRVLMDRLRQEIGSPNEVYLFQFLLVGTLVFLPIALQGASFPLVVRAFVGQRSSVGRDVGRAYSVNTAGAIVGSFLAGFAVMPLFGLRGGITVAMSLNLLVAAAYGVAGVRAGASRRAGAALGIGGIVAVSAVVFGPALDRVALTRGLFRVHSARELYDPAKLAKDRPDLVFYEDGITATTTVEKRGTLVTLKANGKPEASDGADMSTQILVALLPLMMRTVDQEMGGEKVAMIGFGSGVTAGGALQWPLESLEVVEIEPAMLEASRHFNHVNHRPLDDPRTTIVATDGRNFLEYATERYDVIISEPSNPWIAGVASLFTVEHFTRAREKLAPGGVFGQWVQLYEISPDNVKVILATFQAVFPYVQAYSSMPKGTDLILIGSDRPLALPATGFARAWANDTTRAELKRAGVSSAVDPYGLMFMNGPELREFAAGAPLNTDDNGLLEFAAPRDLIRYDIGEQFFAERYFRTDDYGDPRPHLDDWPSGWSHEQRTELAIAAWKAGKPTLADALAPSNSPEYDEPRRAERLELDPLVVATWPFPSSELHRLLNDAARSDAYLQALMWLEKDGEPPRGGFPGEKGLLYAWVLAHQKYYRHALEQLEGLEKQGDPEIVHSVPFQKLTGFVNTKRRRYERSWEAYRRAAELLADQATP